jgi:hypothetical protein
LIGNYHFARDYGCVHPGMPLGRKHLRRSRDAPTGGIGHTQRATSRLGIVRLEVNPLDDLFGRAVSAPHRNLLK